MTKDTRIARAKKELVKAAGVAEMARLNASSRSTGTRTAYKIKAEGCDRALEILSERPPK